MNPRLAKLLDNVHFDVRSEAAGRVLVASVMNINKVLSERDRKAIHNHLQARMSKLLTKYGCDSLEIRFEPSVPAPGTVAPRTAL
jgi:hypothetical protein